MIFKYLVKIIFWVYFICYKSAQNSSLCGMFTYTNENDGYFPLGTSGTGNVLANDHARWLRGATYRTLVEDGDYIDNSELLVCPNLSGFNPPWHQAFTDNYRIGYQFLVNREKLKQAYGYELVERTSKIVSPLSPISADINEFQEGVRTFYSHKKNGGFTGNSTDYQGVDPQVCGAEGGNQSHVDGSVRWYSFSKMTLNYVKSSTAIHRAYFFLPN
jgi:hypothetical protein